MPINITSAVGHFICIFPTTEWQSMTLSNIPLGDFQVEEQKFYVDVELEELRGIKMNPCKLSSNRILGINY